MAAPIHPTHGLPDHRVARLPSSDHCLVCGRKVARRDGADVHASEVR
jgi:hypothetical protein